MGSKLRVTFDGRSRSALLVIPLIVVVAAAAVFTLWDLSKQAQHATHAEALAARELTLTRDITQAAYAFGAGGTSALMELETIAPAIDRVHYGLLYGDLSLNFAGVDSPSLTKTLSEIEPSYLKMRAVLDDVVEGTAPPLTLVMAAEDYRSRLNVPAQLIERAAMSSSNQLENVALGSLIGSFTIAIAVFVLAPVVKRRREGDLNRRLRASGRPDHLTGLIRRQTLLDRIDDAVQAGAAAGEHTAILVVDVDRMSRLNNVHGHNAGDRILQDLASRLKNELRAGDTVARLEDDQFGIVAPGIHRREDAAIVARKTLNALSRPFLSGEVAVTACVGVALAPTDTDSAERLLEDAAIAAVTAKQQGANTFLFYSRDLSSLAQGRMHILDALREALAEGGQLRLAFQPKIDLREGTMAGVEALIRWTHPVRGELMPADFIPLVEESELVLNLERWIIETACQQVAEWRDAGLGGIAVSVNISARQFRNGDLIDVVSGALDRAKIEPELLEIELTEGVLIDDTERARDTLLALQRLGVGIAIDDFGTGYSSLSYLKSFPIDTLKIDRSFIQELSEGTDDAAISTAIIALAHSLDLDVIAEGVEAKEQLDVLLDLDCDVVQGFLFARPLPAASVPGFIERLPELVGSVMGTPGVKPHVVPITRFIG